MRKHLKILLVDDNDSDIKLLEKEFKKAKVPFTLQVVDSKIKFLQELNDFKPDVVLSEHSLPAFNSLEALLIVKNNDSDIPFIFVTGSVSNDFALKCMNAGADDYILKNSLHRLPSSIEALFTKKKITPLPHLQSRATYEEMEEAYYKVEEAYKDIEDAYEKAEEENKNFKDSISYAKQIQEAMLPSLGTLLNRYPESFILYKPKDIVSGDFYWFVECGNKFIIAVADCTGHGVPGALMSTMGCSLLNEIVTIDNITQPSEILSRLNNDVHNLLKQNRKESHSRDGMDIAICSIDKENGKLEFAGANRHLLIFKNQNLQLIKGNSYGIGGIQLEKEREYVNHKMPLDKEDRIYLFTDGYADQFGGRYERRMMTRNLINLLQFMLSFDMLQQQQLLEQWFEKWKRNLEQTDDILVIGIQF